MAEKIRKKAPDDAFKVFFRCEVAREGIEPPTP
jgi:hypothetical protein